jgi:hypothetical protein
MRRKLRHRLVAAQFAFELGVERGISRRKVAS